MTLRRYVYDRFSPYLDPDPWTDFYDDVAQRGTTIAAGVFAVHVGLFFMLQTNFVVPDLKEEPEPDPIPVQIIAYEDLLAQPEPEPEVIDIAPVTPAPAAPPRVKPKPKPTPPPPPPPPPVPEPEPEPLSEPEVEPEPITAPPPPDILTSEASEPSENTISEFTPPVPLEPPVEDTPTEPVIEIFEPVEVPREIEVEIFEPQPIIESEPIAEPVIEPEPTPEPVEENEPEIEIEIFDQPIIEEPLIEETIAPVITETPVELPAQAGPVIDPITEEPLTVAPLIPQPDPQEIEPPIENEIIIATEPEPLNEQDEDQDAPIITTAPTILASPDAPLTPDESDRAIPQEQAAPMTDFLFKPKTGFPPPNPPGGQPSGGAVSLGGGGGAPGGGTRRPSPTARSGQGWTLQPGSTGIGTPGEGYGGIINDIRCRESDRTHLDCPEYTAKYKGRNAAGFESFGRHSNGGVPASSRSARTGTYENPAIGGGGNPWTLAPGDTSVNAGGPSSSVLDDADFGRTFLGTNLGGQNSGGRVRDVFNPQSNETRSLPVLKPPPADDEDE